MPKALLQVCITVVAIRSQRIVLVVVVHGHIGGVGLQHCLKLSRVCVAAATGDVRSPRFSRDSLTLNLLGHKLLVKNLLEVWIELSCNSGAISVRRWALRIVLLLTSLTSALATTLLVSSTNMVSR